jgi:hypothetical protein
MTAWNTFGRSLFRSVGKPSQIATAPESNDADDR